MVDGCGVGGVGTKPKPLLSIARRIIAKAILDKTY